MHILLYFIKIITTKMGEIENHLEIGSTNNKAPTVFNTTTCTVQ